MGSMHEITARRPGNTHTESCVLEDLLQYDVPSEQKGFMKFHCMEDHLRSVRSIWRGNKKRAWVGIDFAFISKA